ncbi:integrase (plasmid) [Cupriavidus sp. USMAA2-4]|uniref:phage integrase family protein n=1 Tax=Cupriavidus sp. USMAA2-4 TaxID=876364 RepID=UPI0008A6CA80|nr:phage integrase family protein [Cupriavidus sp. USMAA2-4]AOY97686.1 integrase [Cupriavidus sp. USMAA2-4]
MPLPHDTSNSPRELPSAAARRRRRSVTRRQLHRGHFGFLRAIIQGLHARPMWERYLAEEGEIEADAELVASLPATADDQAVQTDGDRLEVRAARAFAGHPKVRRVTAWLRDELAAAAGRADRPGTARRLRLDLRDFRQIGRPGLGLPSLEEFVAEAGLDGFGESEQLAAYTERYGSALKREAKRAALMRRQLAAIDWLEEKYVQPVLAGDACRAWLAEPLAARLEVAGVSTLADLLDRINGLGAGWARGIAAIGAGKARAIEAFLRVHAESLGRGIGGHVAVPRRQRYAHELDRVVPRGAPDNALVPLDKLVLPAALDGRDGAYRLPQARCLISAHNDYEAVLSWLRSKPGLPPEQVLRLRERRRDVSTAPGPYDWLQYLSNTQRAYRKEAERFLLWAMLARRKPLSSMDTDDCLAYRDFLAAPPADWCAPRSRERWTPLWRPFEGPLNPRAQAYAIGVLTNLYGYLNAKNYLAGNPWQGIHVPRSAKPELDVGRSLTEDQWTFVSGCLARLPATSIHQRLQVALPLLYATGLRLSEVISVTTDDLEWVSLAKPGTSEREEGWWLTVVGKGNKLRRVPVPDTAVTALGRYLEARGFAADPTASRGVALLGHATDQAERAPWAKRHSAGAASGLAAATLYRQIKRFFQACAAELAPVDARGAERLASASTHWMRHTHISHALAAGAPLEAVKQNAGHASLDTTTRYVTTEDARRMAAMRRLWAKT